MYYLTIYFTIFGQTILNFMHHTLPRELAEFLDFHHYELTHLLQSMARQFFEEGDKVLSEGHPVVFTPLQVKHHHFIM